MSSKAYKSARVVRIAVSALVAVAITAAVAAGYSCWLTRMQIVPALLSCSVAWIALWAVITALFGRAYCSSACALGTLQDLFIFLSPRRRRGFFYSAPRPALRWGLVVIATVAAAVGLGVVVSALDPSAAYSRIVAYLALPAVKPVVFSAAGAIAAALTLAVVAMVALWRGRLICNTVCPVGTLLGALGRYSLFHVDINTDKCIGCNRCVERCKAECINPADHTVDLSRCVVCFDCLTDCPSQAITYRRGRHRLKMPLLQAAGPSASASTSATGPIVKPMDRRKFLASIVASGAALSAVAASKSAPRPINYPVPPGTDDRTDYLSRCTACGACAAACPTGAVKASAAQLGIRHSLTPYLDFNSGPCRYDCTACTTVCHTGAIHPLTTAEKHRYVIGKARIIPELCLLYEGAEACGECVRRCPVRAVSITVADDGRRLPKVDFDRCIGCGECQWVCPARPRAFIIEGE